MKAVPLWKVLFFVFIVLPVFLSLLVIFIVPLILILLLVMPVMGRRFAFRAKNFGKEYFHRGDDGEETASCYDAEKEDGEIVDVEGVVVESSIEEESPSPSKMLSSNK